MNESAGSQGSEADLDELLEGYPPRVRELTVLARQLVREIAPDGKEEVDRSAKMLGVTFQPGTYKGLVLSISPQRDYVNIILAKGAELLEDGLDERGLLAGTGKKARHIKVRDEETLSDPGTRRLIEAAVERTPRA